MTACCSKFHVDGNTFRQETTLTNTGRRLPFGGGFHPFFPALPDTTLQFQADGIWLADDRRIPTRLVPTRDHPEWDFGRAKALPSTLLDNAYTDWTGRAEITQPTLGIVVRVTASTNLSTAVAFVPFPKRPFFCFEPVMHPNDAVNLPGMPGMKVLDTGESISFAMEIVWLPLI